MTDEHGFDMEGPDVGVDWSNRRGFKCECRWASDYHGLTCPEHNKVGKPCSSFRRVVSRAHAEDGEQADPTA